MVARISGGLFADALARRRAGHLAGEIDGVAMHDGLRHARADSDAMNAHEL